MKPIVRELIEDVATAFCIEFMRHKRLGRIRPLEMILVSGGIALGKVAVSYVSKRVQDAQEERRHYH